MTRRPILEIANSTTSYSAESWLNWYATFTMSEFIGVTSAERIVLLQGGYIEPDDSEEGLSKGWYRLTEKGAGHIDGLQVERALKGMK